MKKFSVLSLVVALFVASTVVGQDEQASPSDTPAVAPAVQAADTAIEPQPVVQAAEGTVVESSVMPMEPQVVGQAINAPMVMNNNCCGSVQRMNVFQRQPMVSQPCCGQTAAAPVGCNSCAAPTRVYRVRRQLFRRTSTRGNCCN